jgi:DNA-directed RNA polymerase specialized sigma24 family protein
MARKDQNALNAPGGTSATAEHMTGNLFEADYLELVKRSCSAESEACTEVIRRLGKELTCVIARLLGPQCNSAEVNAALVRVFGSLPNYRGEVALRIWLLRKAVSVVSMQREVFRRGTSPCETTATPPQNGALDGLLPHSQALDKLLTCLSEVSRTTFVLHELVGLTTVDIAQILDTTLVTTKARLYFARRKLIATIASELQGREQLPLPFSQSRATPFPGNGGPPAVQS